MDAVRSWKDPESPAGAVALTDSELDDINGAVLPLVVALGIQVGRMVVLHYGRKAAAHVMVRHPKVNPFPFVSGQPSAGAAAQPLSNLAGHLLHR